MNTYSQNRYNMRHGQPGPWHRNARPQGNNVQRNYHFNSSWVSQSLPGSENYWCETCDKGFMTKPLLDHHIQRHQKCNIDGCQFVAHPKVITKHIQMQHATGLYKRIGKLDNPDEIKKWREERKRKYPTKENIEKRQAEVKEKIGRGEKMGLKRDMKNNKLGFHNKRQQNFTHGQHKTFKNKKLTPELYNKKRPVKKIVHDSPPPKEESRKLQPFKGIQDLVDSHVAEDETSQVSNDLIEDDEVIDANFIDKPVINPNVCGALTSLICSYESTDEEDVGENAKITSNSLNGNPPVETIIKMSDLNQRNEDKKGPKITNNVVNSNHTLTCQNESDNESGPEESTITKNEVNSNIDSKPPKYLPSRKDRLKKIENKNIRHKAVNLKRKLPSTLLEKLLHKEIQHERNIILQCVRYVVKNNYFDKT